MAVGVLVRTCNQASNFHCNLLRKLVLKILEDPIASEVTKLLFTKNSEHAIHRIEL